MESIDKSVSVRKIYGACFLAYTALIGLLFIIQVWRIYTTGVADGELHPYTREKVAAAFREILIPVVVWFVAFIGGLIVFAKFPEGKKKLLAGQSPEKAVAKLQARLTQENQQIAQEKRYRRIVWSVCGALCVLAAAVCLVYLFTDERFEAVNGEGINAEISAMVLYILPWVLGSFAAVLVCAYLHTASVKRELSFSKAAVAKEAKEGTLKKTEEKPEKSYRKILSSPVFLWSVRGVVFILGVTLFIFGAVNGGFLKILAKAAEICMECVGLG